MSRKLRPDEEALWRVVASRTTPLHPENRRARPPEFVKPDRKPYASAAPVPAFRLGDNAPVPETKIDMAPSPSEAVKAQPLRIDRRTHTRLSRGKLAPEARIDLHGMTLDQAHAALIAFILSARQEGRRLVLVITGKGRSEPSRWYDRPGALRREAPHWLSSPPIAGFVQQVLPAHRTHGGAGAYYVVLHK